MKTKDNDEIAAELIYDTLEASSMLPPNAILTPGSINFKQAPFILLNEFVTVNNKYIELLSNPSQSMEDIFIIFISDNSGIVKLSIYLDPIRSGEAGITVISDRNNKIEKSPALTTITTDLSDFEGNNGSLLLIYSPKHRIETGYDLDSNNNGKLNLPDGAVVLDKFGWGDSTFSKLTAVVDYRLQAATRYKDNRICSINSWIYGELNEKNFNQFKSKNIPKGSHITPGNINIAMETSLLVKPIIETSRSNIDNPDADDIAFWINHLDSEKSLIIATQKNAGYSIYNSRGETLLDALPGENRYNNVDVMYGFELQGNKIDIAVFTDRNNNKLAIYKIIDVEPYIVDITDYDSNELFKARKPGKDTAYGEGVYKSPVSGDFYVFVTQNSTWNVSQFKLIPNGNTIGWQKIKDITLESDDNNKHAEGIVVDQEYGKVYIAQKEVGI